MKYLVKLISIIYCLNCFSQTPNPDLFQTWYLYDYYSTDDNIHHPVSAIIPSISPNVTFSQTSNFNGIGACNSFGGTFSSPFNDVVVFDSFAGTLLLCGSSEHTSFEGAFFSLFQSGGQYYISGTGNNMNLRISTPIFVNYEFRNYQLNTENFSLNQIVVYPNPAESKLFVDSRNNLVEKIEIFNSLGESVKTINAGFEVINISDFASGVYLMKVSSEDKIVTKKIIKI
ncbi:T9SS type A sorting domain-containing protein [Flavobacterium sedimenticola]|uniref:T9SS type A sorting domain-containing protein n=1 Tax=Flavobacterium sedimenticola TaxID=3043286 RepID=A0ABT6XP62_9FLAO|nr:T9SS type A sorting domain-containing protein [Flavobacterium sedimenticola]MDI9256874.1 T9SS type A sorting domain-containing protein [Flavobacterium sedimenticola]